MSHIVTIASEMTNEEMIRKAAGQLGYAVEHKSGYVFYDGTVKTGVFVSLPGWRYPVCIEDSGKLFFDNYEGAWGNIAELKTFQNEYALIDVTEKLEAQKKQRKIRSYTVSRKDDEIVVEVSA
jgi:hypothetical protein